MPIPPGFPGRDRCISERPCLQVLAAHGNEGGFLQPPGGEHLRLTTTSTRYGRDPATTEGGTQSMKNLRRVGLILATTAISLGFVSVSAPAQADTSWGCPSCRPSR